MAKPYLNGEDKRQDAVIFPGLNTMVVISSISIAKNSKLVKPCVDTIYDLTKYVTIYDLTKYTYDTHTLPKNINDPNDRAIWYNKLDDIVHISYGSYTEDHYIFNTLKDCKIHIDDILQNTFVLDKLLKRLKCETYLMPYRPVNQTPDTL
jgi:hypothetical protein